MINKLFIIGNGFDLAHDLPTRFDPHFKSIAQKHEQDNFWELYQTQEDDIWSDFENLLAHPDFNEIEEIFDGYAPDYLSDRESDRDSIITQVDLNGNLQEALYEFSHIAEDKLRDVAPKRFFEELLDQQAYYISFNYTHTLEKIYHIPQKHILHIHGEVGKNNLALGYPEGDFAPEKYSYDARAKGYGPYRELDIEEYANNIEDYYIRTAYTSLIDKCKSFSKEIKLDLLSDSLTKNRCNINEIIIFGHSCAIDFDYFDYLNCTYPNAHWNIFVKGDDQERNAYNLIRDYNITNYNITPV